MCENRTVEFPKLTDEEHDMIIAALAQYSLRTFCQSPREIRKLQEYIRENVEHDDIKCSSCGCKRKE
jgi:hypothetical protein